MHSFLLLASFLLSQSSATADLDAKIEKMRAERKTPGISIVVSREGKILYAKGFGMENLKTKKLMSPISIHELASVSKQFTATAIVLLQQDEKLKISDSLAKYFPSKNKNWDGITLELVLHHESGLPDYLETIDVAKEYSNSQLVAMIRERPLVFEPGSKWAYSNSGYMLLGLVAEKVSGMKLADFLSKRVFKPLAMANASGNDPFSKRIAMGYSMKGGKVVEQGVTSKSLSLTGDGEVMCSALDLAKWEASLWGEKILDENLLDLMFEPSHQPMRPYDPKSPRYGMGWVIGEANGRKIMNHSGGWMGTSTIIHRDLATKTCFIVLCNADFDQAQRYVQPLAQHFLS